MKLADAPLGQMVTIAVVGGDRAFRRRLMELGLLPGTRVKVVGVAPLGDPLELLVRGCSLSIRKAEARSVGVACEATLDAERAAVSSSGAPALGTVQLTRSAGCPEGTS
jgi:ferrous iron transport protein A